jgi:putative transposase
MRSMTFGSLRFDRRSIPVAMVRISQRSTADDSVLDEDARPRAVRAVGAGDDAVR